MTPVQSVDISAHNGLRFTPGKCIHVEKVSAGNVMTELPPPTPLRVLPTMAIRVFKLKLSKVLKLPLDTFQLDDADVYLVMGDDKLSKLDLREEERDLAWWGIQNGSHVIVLAKRSHHQRANCSEIVEVT
jgi:hypothetical protein